MKKLQEMTPYELGLTSNPLAVSFLREYLISGRLNEKRLAASAIGKLSACCGDRCNDAVSELIECIRDTKDTQARLYALNALEKLEIPERAIKTIEQVIEGDGKDYNREAAKRVLNKYNNKTANNSKWLEAFGGFNVECLYHLTHIRNVKNISKNGIFNHYDAHDFDKKVIDISDPGAQRWRDDKEPCYGRKIHEYAALYINPRNPMLYVRRELQDELCIIEVFLSVMTDDNCLITDGNAASRDTKFTNKVEELELLPWDVLNADYWANFSDGKRQRCAEVLIYPRISPLHIGKIHCNSDSAIDFLSNCSCTTSVTKELYF